MGIIENTELAYNETGPTPPNRLQTGKADIFADYFLQFLAHLIAVLTKNIVDCSCQAEACDDDHHSDGGKEFSRGFHSAGARAAGAVRCWKQIRSRSDPCSRGPIQTRRSTRPMRGLFAVGGARRWLLSEYTKTPPKPPAHHQATWLQSHNGCPACAFHGAKSSPAV